MDIATVNKLLSAYLAEYSKELNLIRNKDKSTLTEQIFEQDNGTIDFQFKCIGTVLARIANQHVLIGRDIYNQLRKYHHFLQRELFDRGVLTEEECIYGSRNDQKRISQRKGRT